MIKPLDNPQIPTKSKGIPLLQPEIDAFLIHPRNMRILLIANFTYAFVFPILDFFVSAYVMRNTQNVRLTMCYNMALFAGIPFAFFINGYLLRLIPTRFLFSGGMMLTAITMAGLMSLPALNLLTIGITGFIMGLSVGTYWSNRDFLALSSTEDSNRNYYYSMESFFGTLCGVIVPFLVGSFIGLPYFQSNVNVSYYILTGVVFAISCVASVIVCQGTFQNPKATRFVYFSFHKLWYQVLGMSAARGLASGFSTAIPIILTARLMHTKDAASVIGVIADFLKGFGLIQGTVTDENVVGMLQSVGMFIAAIGMYIIARVSKPEHRIRILTVGLVLYMIATLTHAVLFSALGVIVYSLLQLLCRPLIETVALQTTFRAIDTMERIEGRNSFAYIFNNEFGIVLGRCSGALLFIIVAGYDETFALRYVLLIISTLQVSLYFFCKHILTQCNTLSKDIEVI